MRGLTGRGYQYYSVASKNLIHAYLTSPQTTSDKTAPFLLTHSPSKPLNMAINPLFPRPLMHRSLITTPHHTISNLGIQPYRSTTRNSALTFRLIEELPD